MITTNDQPSPVNNQDAVDDLANNLKLSQDLLAVLHEEGAALRAMDSQELLRLSRKKTSLLVKIQYLDEALRKSLAEPATRKETSGLAPQQAQVIDQYKNKIRLVRQEIQTRNMLNKRFTEDTLGYLNDAISLFTRQARDENTYRIPGRSQARCKDLPSFISCEA